MAKWLKLHVIYIYIFHLTWPMSLHYLVKRRCSKFLPNTGFITIGLLRFGVKLKRAYTVATTFLLTDHCQACIARPRTSLLFQWDGAPAHREHAVAFLEWQRDARTLDPLISRKLVELVSWD